MEPLTEVRGLTKHFPVDKGFLARLMTRQERVVHAVDGVSFSINKGEVLGLAGESGCGKTTTGRLLLRLMKPTAGEVFFKGQPVLDKSREEMRSLRARMQVIFQDPFASLNPRMSIGSAIGHPLLIHTGLTKGEARDRVLRIMEKVGLIPADFLARKYPHQISGGQRQRVVIARALVTGPEFVVADEPLAMADVSVRALILDLMIQLKEDFNLTYLFITHDLATAKYICDRIAVMYLGQIVEIGPLEEVFRNPVHPYTESLLAAVPVPDPRFRRTRPIPKGEIPDAISPPPGCRFHPRCDLAEARCSREEPRMLEVSAGHWAACRTRSGGGA